MAANQINRKHIEAAWRMVDASNRNRTVPWWRSGSCGGKNGDLLSPYKPETVGSIPTAVNMLIEDRGTPSKGFAAKHAPVLFHITER